LVGNHRSTVSVIPAKAGTGPNFSQLMPRNVEIKARVAQPSRLLEAVIDIADRGPTVFAQDDTFFACPAGRLKLRTFSTTEGQLIFYRRDDLAGPKLSEYVMASTSEPDALRGTLTLAYGVVGRVRKTRTLFLVGPTRVHLDDVEGLGHYLELEVVLTPEQTIDDGQRIAQELMTKLGIDAKHLVRRAYVDLLADVPQESQD
jgi:predicted adenylyl cyclase CyaB